MGKIHLQTLLRNLDDKFNISKKLIGLKSTAENNLIVKEILKDRKLIEYLNEKYKHFTFEDWGWDEIINNLIISYKDGLLLFHYGDVIQTNRKWNSLTKQARGIILDVKNGFEITHYPFDKFFNLNEFGIEEAKIENIPVNIPFTAVDKLDGSMGMLYKNREGKYVITTKGSFYSDIGQLGTQILYRNYADVLRNKNDVLDKYFLTFEIISPKNRVVIDYKNIEDIFLIGARRKDTLELLTQNELNQLSKELGFKRPDIYIENYNNLQEFTEIIYSNKDGFANKEGAVLYFDNGLILKVKSSQYLELHKTALGFNSLNVITNHIKKNGISLRPKLEDIDGIKEEFMDELNRDYNKFIKFIYGLKYSAVNLFINVGQEVLSELDDSNLNKLSFRKGFFEKLTKYIKETQNDGYQSLVNGLIGVLSKLYFEQLDEKYIGIENKKLFKKEEGKKAFISLVNNSKLLEDVIIRKINDYKNYLKQMPESSKIILLLGNSKAKYKYINNIEQTVSGGELLKISLNNEKAENVLKENLELIKLGINRTILVDMTDLNPEYKDYLIEEIKKYDSFVESIDFLFF